MLPLRDGFVIGRVSGCDLVIDDTKASRKHARVIVEGGVVEIEDLGSSNGTLLNGKPVTRRVLRSGDEVQIGKTVLTFHEGAPGSSAAGARSAAAPALAPDDDVDLFGDAPAAAAPRAAPAVTPPAPAAVPPSAPSLPRPPAPPVAPPRSAAPPSPPPPRPAVVEFADEVVEVRKPAPGPAPSARTGAAVAEPTVQRQQRVLQYSKQADGGGMLSDDLAQMSSGTRSLIYAAVLAAAIAVAWLLMKFVG